MPNLRPTLDALGWSVLELARQIGWSPDRVRNWTRTGYRPPPDVAAWLERRLADRERVLRDDPPPPPR